MSKDVFYRYLDKILLASILGGAGLYGANSATKSSDRVADELTKIRETLAVAVSKVGQHDDKLKEHDHELDDHNRRITHLEDLIPQRRR